MIIMSNIDIFELDELIHESLNKLPFDELVNLTASELHEIWKKTTYIRDDEGKILLDEKGEPQQIEKWKKLDPNENAEEREYVEKILSDSRFLELPFIRKNEDNTISINIAKMKYSQLSPHWQKENKEAAEVAVELTLDNFVYLADPNQRDVLVHVIGSAIHLLWKNRPANAYAKETELGQRYSNISLEEQMKDVRHIFIAEKSIAYIAKKLGIDKELQAVENLKNTPKRSSSNN